MDIVNKFKNMGEFALAGLNEEPERGAFYRKALGLRRHYENCELAEYNGELLYPSGVLPGEKFALPNFLFGIAINVPGVSAQDAELGEVAAKDWDPSWIEYVPGEHRVAGNVYTHSMPNYERVLKEGLLSYVPRIEKIADADMREGLLHLIEGIGAYTKRCAKYIEEKGADKKLVDALNKVPMMPAENIFEAIVCWNLLLYLDSCDNLGCVASGLYPYYKGEDVTALIANLYDNLDKNGGWSMALGTDYNPLTLQCLEASKGKRRPMIELFVDETTPDEVWEKAFEVIKTSNGQPAFYNPKVLLAGLQKKFNIPDDDIKKFCGGGCTESTIAGKSYVGALDAGINLLLILEKVIYSCLEKAETFQEFYDSYINEVAAVVEKVTCEVSRAQLYKKEHNPLPMRTLLTDDCIDNEADFNAGGTRYKWSIINFAGIINVVDSLLVIKDMIFEKNQLTKAEMLQLLKNNDAAFLEQARKHKPCFGQDDDEANAMSRKVTEDIFGLLDEKTPAIGGAFLPASIQFQSQADAGRNVGATPDGRESGAPLCDSLAAIFEKDTKGYTALLNSVTALDLKKALGTPVLNFNIEPDFDENILKALILGYMQNGGVQMQVTCTSREALLEAYENPEKHRNLVVRVGGYSEYFCNLTDELKKMVIARTIQRVKS